MARQTEDIPDAIVALGGTPPALDGPFMWVENDTSAYKRRKVTITDHYGETRDAWRVVRPLWADAMRALRAGRINALMVYDLDRLARDPYDLEDAIEVVTRYGAVIKSATASELNLMTDTGQMMARFLIIIANKASADTGRRVTRKHLELAREGKPVGGNRPFGFEKNKVTHDPVEVAVLREVVDDVVNGKSVRDVVAALNSAGV